MKLRIWHIPQIPMEPFHVEVGFIDEAKMLLRVLADYDLFQYNHNVKPDYSNASGLSVWDDDDQEWVDWYDEASGEDDIWALMHHDAAQKLP